MTETLSTHVGEERSMASILVTRNAIASSCLCGMVLSAPVAQGADCQPLVAAKAKVVQQPGRHSTMTFSATGSSQRIETIVADGQVFSRDNDGDWKRLAMSIADIEETSHKFPFNAKNCQRVGETTTEQGPAVEFAYQNDFGETGRAWIGVND